MAKVWQVGKYPEAIAYIARLKEKMLQWFALEDLEPDIAYIATYEKRRKRLNHLEGLIQLFDYQPQCERS